MRDALDRLDLVARAKEEFVAVFKRKSTGAVARRESNCAVIGVGQQTDGTSVRAKQRAGADENAPQLAQRSSRVEDDGIELESGEEFRQRDRIEVGDLDGRSVYAGFIAVHADRQGEGERASARLEKLRQRRPRSAYD